MKNLILVLAIVILCMLFWPLAKKPDIVQQPVETKQKAAISTQSRSAEEPAVKPPAPVPAPEKPAASSAAIIPSQQPIVAEAPPAPPAKPAVAPEAKPAQQPVKAAPGEPLISERAARQALNFVGADPIAELVWIQAINDPALSRKARRNLIEDLNEEGFPNPKRITPDDLPLIVSRILLIEELAPHAIDDANADAFREAYKDLVNMFKRLTLR